MSDKSKITLKWPLIDGILLKSDTTYIGPKNDQATYIHEVYEHPDGQNTEVTKGIYSDGYRFIDMITGDNTFIQGYRPDGSINYTILPEEYKKLQKDQVPKGFDGMKIAQGNMQLIPKGAKGWYASEMKTWSPEKMYLILQQYGKDGLTPNTYTYLINRVGEQKTKSPYIREQASTETKLPVLLFQATSLGIPNAYGITSEEELQRLIQSKQDVINKEAAKQQVSRQQQAQYEDIWARKNYKAMTGKDWHAGIDLSNYTMSAIRKLQKEIGTSVDGKWGVKSQQAYDIYLKKQNPEPKSSTSVSTQNTSTVTDLPQQTNYWELVKNDPDFALWLYTSGGLGSGRRLANLINVGGNYVMGMLNPNGKTVFNLGQGLLRLAVASALYGQQHGITGIKDRAHSALGGLSGKHSGEEFRENTNTEGYLSLAMSSPYHNVYGQSEDARFTEKGFESVGDGYTYNNVWHGKDATGKDKVVKVMGDGEGDASLGESYQAYKSSRESGNSMKAAMETAATVRGVNTARHSNVAFVPQDTLEEWAKEYYLAHTPSNKSVVKSLFGGMLKHITGH